jgi:PAS domain S-box-containing protein
MEPTQHTDVGLDSAARIAALETELELARRQLAEAQQLARIGSWEWDIPRNLVWWSDELFRVYGLEPRSIVPTYAKFLEHVHPDDRADVDARNHKAFEDHQPFEDVKRVVRDDDGREILMRTQGEVITSADGEPLRMVGICEDVTDQVRARDAEREVAATEALKHRAYQINDEIIQQLVVASLLIKRGDVDKAEAAMADAYARAQAIVAEFLGDADLKPGDLRRDGPATAPAPD